MLISLSHANSCLCAGEDENSPPLQEAVGAQADVAAKAACVHASSCRELVVSDASSGRDSGGRDGPRDGAREWRLMAAESGGTRTNKVLDCTVLVVLVVLIRSYSV